MSLKLLNNLTVVHLDPAVGSTNLGDDIISEAVSFQLRTLFPDARIMRISSRDIGCWSRKQLLRHADLIFLGGSNALSSDPVFGYRQFAMGRVPPYYLKDVILFGVGWWKYQGAFGHLAKHFYRRTLRQDMVHSVRDDYAQSKLRGIGPLASLNTACPTLWQLERFDSTVSDRVIFTLTDYNQNQARDCEFVNNITDRFDDIYFWPQGMEDLTYLKSLSQSLDITRIKMIAPVLQDFDRVLQGGYGYIGTRLHAGIRALQLKCPSYIIPIDNRAHELGKTEPIPLVAPSLNGVEPGVGYQFEPQLRPEVTQYMKQFKRFV